MEIGLTDQVRKMCGFRPLLASAEDADLLFCLDLGERLIVKL